ncbi:hypothetical protein AAW51_1507 [Caldimonas brevitalea]|uniref:Endonuclease/exonuclease/phosphatase domain-containing protein n=1 Tax=Caldimonas brevitalea TaxID=413882 RepID=A0A0G3BJN8_9BURK|nr:hypothetical protein AAW51_1507 [Caldimonas brevitalea]
MTVRVLTVNTHKGFNALNRRFILHELREAVRHVSADVVFLQEVLGTHEVHSAKVQNWPEAPHYEFLADEMWSDFAYGRNAVYPEGHHGNAVLSKFPILRHENCDVSVEGPEKRGLLHCVLDAPAVGQELHVVCVHLGLREAHRREQLRLLCQRIDRFVPPEAPLVIAGDFNDWRLQAHAQLHGCAGLREVFVEAQGQAARTFPARWPLLRLDRIYVRNAKLARPIPLPPHPWRHLSDHAPLAAEIMV